MEKAESGFIGIRNPGCICYMNSLMQQFFMMKSLRFGILSAPDAALLPAPVGDNGEPVSMEEVLKEDVLYQLQTLFGHLLMSERKFYNPMPWLNAYKDESGKPTNVLIQQDAQEYFNMFCDRLEHRLKGSAQEKLLQVRWERSG